ncbi:MAG: MBL fold metallo-hydrolase, partial [Bradyrhizobium sp.]|nr:MBL fold metallo-hydrolase [Bradyrhizobium sp.]
PKLVRIATDYNDYVKPSVLPDIVTMNRAHSTHYTDRPDAGIKFVLRGWKDDGKPTDWDVQFQDVRVRSVTTNIRDYAGGTQRHGNSIFIVEVANLCIAGADCTQGAADDPDALLFELHAQPLHRAHQQGLGHRAGRRAIGGALEANIAGEAETSGAAGPLLLGGA